MLRLTPVRGPRFRTNKWEHRADESSSSRKNSMANQCVYCNKRRIPTNMLVLGPDWIEFCEPCGVQNEASNRETGEVLTIKALFDRLVEERKTKPKEEVASSIEPGSLKDRFDQLFNQEEQ